MLKNGKLCNFFHGFYFEFVLVFIQHLNSIRTILKIYKFQRLPQIEPKKAIFRDNKEGASAYNFKDDSDHRKFDSQASNTKRKMVVVNDPNRVKNDSTAVNASFGQNKQQKSYGYEFLNKIVHSASDIEELWVQ